MSIIYKINELGEILESLNKQEKVNLKEGILLIDIDKACMTEEKNLAQLYDRNPLLRNQIVTSTQKMLFENTDKLMSTRSDLFDFVDKCKCIFKNVAFVTHKSENEFSKISRDINRTDIDIVGYKSLMKGDKEIIYYVDSTSEAFDKLNKNESSMLFLMYPI